ncbi:MAG: ATP-grasp domain-containing protein [Flavobacteriales bacterium]|nr:ATP-grasp domain-containing protein [Flavobacteriales bacterium]
MKRTLLMLGGADIQVTAIQQARELGYRVVSCDYLPSNPGHAFADAYHNVSTTDLDAVLDVAQREGIAGISAYASDPAAVTAAYVAERLGLPGNAYEATQRIQDKTSFRALQHELGIPAPRVWVAHGPADLVEAARQWPHGGIIKPVDTSGSKGVHRVDPQVMLEEAVRIWHNATGLSRVGRVIVEEYLPRLGPQMTGDALIHDGRVLFWCFGDVHFNDRINGLVPRGVTVPGTIPTPVVEQAMAHVQQLVTALGLKQGVFNIDLFQDAQGRPILVDIGARNGGNMLNTLYHRRTGVDLMTISLQQCMGDPFTYEVNEAKDCFVAHHVVHSLVSGRLRDFRLSERVSPWVFHRSFNPKPGDRVGRFTDSRFRLGLLLFQFPTAEDMHDVYRHIYDHVIVEVDPDTHAP